MRPLSQEKRAFLHGAIRRFHQLAAEDPVDAVVLSRALREGAHGGLAGALAGGAGGMLIAPEGEEGDMALRGALLGGGANALRRGLRSTKDTRELLENIDSLPTATARMNLRRKLRKIQEGGRMLAEEM